MAAGYVVVLATIRGWNALGLAIAAAAFAGLLAREVWQPGRPTLLRKIALLAWVPLHLLLLATGSLASPLLPLAAAWIVGVGWMAPRTAVPGALFAAVALLAAQWVRTGPVTLTDAAGLAVLLGLALLVHRFRDRVFPPANAVRGKGEREGITRPPEHDADVLPRALRLVLGAMNADEASFWVLDEPRGALRRIARAGGLAEDAPADAGIPLDGHPFGWVVREQVHVHLERGRRELPSSWAAEMLLIPVNAPNGLLALAYRDAVPEGVEITALDAGHHLAEMLWLLQTAETARLNDERVHALLDTTRSLSGELDRRASTDGLTDLPNRGIFDMRFTAAADQFQRYGRPFGLILLDIDHFKKFNDRWGDEAGDRVLRHVGQLIRSTIREVDLPARFGGEEFVVLLPETPLRDAVDAAERLRVAIEERPLAWSGLTLYITASLGVASCPECRIVPGELLDAADAALYQSKADGRNRITAAPDAERAGR